MFKRNNLNNLVLNSLIGIIIFLLPTNFFLKLFESGAYVNGLRIDYLIPKLYLSDIFILILLLFWLINWFKRNSLKNKTWKLFKSYLTKEPLLISLLVIFFLRQFLTLYPLSSVIYLFRVIELGLFAGFLIKNKAKINPELIEKSVLATLFFQSSVAI